MKNGFVPWAARGGRELEYRPLPVHALCAARRSDRKEISETVEDHRSLGRVAIAARHLMQNVFRPVSCRISFHPEDDSATELMIEMQISADVGCAVEVSLAVDG